MPATFPRPMVALTLLALLPLAGCGPDDGLPTRLPVSGTVRYQGQPLPDGTINFVPDDPEGRGATGSIEDGRYRLTTMSSNDGVIPGRYKISISSTEGVDLSAAQSQSGPGAMDQVAGAQIAQQAKSRIPERYNDANQSGLTAEVQRGSTTFDFDLAD